MYLYDTSRVPSPPRFPPQHTLRTSAPGAHLLCFALRAPTLGEHRLIGTRASCVSHGCGVSSYATSAVDVLDHGIAYLHDARANSK